MPPIRPLLRPPIVALFLLVVFIVLHFVLPLGKVISFPYNLTGVLVIVLGLLVMVWGSLAFNKHKVELIPGSKSVKLVRDGPFVFTRNPMYLGMVVLTFGVALLFGGLLVFLVPVLLFLYLNFFMIPFEERLMERTFRTSYENYKKEVRRWI